MNGFLEDLKGSFGILSNADVMSYLLRGLMFTLVISVIAIGDDARHDKQQGPKKRIDTGEYHRPGHTGVIAKPLE